MAATTQQERDELINEHGLLRQQLTETVAREQTAAQQLAETQRGLQEATRQCAGVDVDITALVCSTLEQIWTRN